MVGYQTIFSNIHVFLPAGSGIRPNTLHVILHTATLATMVLLSVVTAPQP